VTLKPVAAHRGRIFHQADPSAQAPWTKMMLEIFGISYSLLSVRKDVPDHGPAREVVSPTFRAIASSEPRRIGAASDRGALTRSPQRATNIPAISVAS
jgi:hypothetical protein